MYEWMNEWTNDLKKDIKLENMGIRLNWNKECGV